MAAPTNFCSFYKFGFCKFGNKCRKLHYSEICQHKFCENVKFCEKSYFCAYGFCKFGNDCQFRHENPPSRKHANKDSELIDKNKALKKEQVEMNEKHEKLQVQIKNIQTRIW